MTQHPSDEPVGGGVSFATALYGSELALKKFGESSLAGMAASLIVTLDRANFGAFKVPKLPEEVVDLSSKTGTPGKQFELLTALLELLDLIGHTSIREGNQAVYREVQLFRGAVVSRIFEWRSRANE